MLWSRLLPVLLLLVSSVLCAQTLTWQPQHVEQGSPVLFTLILDRPATRVTATWLGKELGFFPANDRRTWYALAGTDVEQGPASYPVSISGTYASGGALNTTQEMQITAANFHSSTLSVAKAFIAPSPAAQRQMERDAVAKKRAFASSASQPLWSGSFAAPVASRVFDNFGDNRIFNGKKVSIHRGSDFPARPGTPVHALNSGRVVLAQRMFLEGNCVIIDHGNQLFSIYMHFSRLQVKAGEMVKKGQLLGLSGATGRVTGPHLHVSMRWSGENLNPAALLAMQLPETSSIGPAAVTVPAKPIHRKAH
ncbi:M23 family metallopeptidase [Terriglobus albidus]|uniref:M23 family metallopeptidase n=1 Tax=Terriglobus albidus TaxID=1592106 RepID=A0A5B9EJ45_9BACT|nr:M23 family metallopeptidase [Terriglobus albidus]QEE31085.1 M23 family metallopeptidase [Terriglobus albidus]